MFYVSAANPFSIAAFEATYRRGAPWLDREAVCYDLP